MWNLLYLLDYFILLPLMSLFPVPVAYRLARWRGRWRAWWNPARPAQAAMYAEKLLGGQGNPGAARFLEIVSCDELDAYLFLAKPFRHVRKYIRIEGAEYLHEVQRRGKGAVLLGAHFGGALFVNPLLRALGLSPQLIMRPVVKEEFPHLFHFLYWYFRFRLWCVTRAVGAAPLFSGKGVEEAVAVLRQGTFLWIALDVPPNLTGKTTPTQFFGRPARFPYGPFLIAARAEVPILPFFTSVDENNHRTFRFFPPIWLTALAHDADHAFHHCVHLLESEIRSRPEQWFLWEGADVFFEPASL